MILDNLFPNAKGYASAKIAWKKLEEVMSFFPDWEMNRTFIAVVHERKSDGRFLPVVIVGRNYEGNAPTLAHMGLCVTNL